MQFSRFAHGSLSLVALFLSASSVAGDTSFSLSGTCDSCEVYGTFKCGNDIYICPDVDHICSVQPSKNSVYHLITQEQCNQMQDVALDEKCIALPEQGVTNPKALSNRVCYPGGDGYHGMKEDGKCEACEDSFATSTIGIVSATYPPTEPETTLDITSPPTDGDGTEAPEELQSPPTDGTEAPEELQSQCSCGVNAENAGSFKCGNDIYVCPGQEEICNVQASTNSVYYSITQEQCSQMQAVAIGTKCVPLPDHGITAPKDLSNRVCYDNEGPGVNGMKEDGSCGICQSTIVPPFQTEELQSPPTDGTEAPEELQSPPTDGTEAPTEPETTLDITSPPTDGTEAPEELQSQCSCGVNAENAGSFKCGNDIYVCPGQEEICNVQASTNSVYYSITQEQCSQMQAVAIGTKCVPLPDHGITAPKDLSNRVCYDNEGPGVNGMKEDGSCGICQSTIVPPFQTPLTEFAETDPETGAPEEDVSFFRTSSPTTAPPTGAPTASKKVCAGDITVIKTNGVTGFPSSDDKHGVRILSQDSSTVTVALDQQWIEDTMDHIFFSYKPSLFDNKCYQQQNVAGGATYKDTLTMTCNVLTPVAYLEICVADTSLEGNATIPKCCQSQVAPETPKVCYHLEIKCETGCTDETLSSRFLRGTQQ